jgi:hypothetical protein
MSSGGSHSGVALLLVRCLENEGVSHVFGIPGEENIHFVDALSKSTIRYLGCAMSRVSHNVDTAFGNPDFVAYAGARLRAIGTGR